MILVNLVMIYISIILLADFIDQINTLPYDN